MLSRRIVLRIAALALAVPLSSTVRSAVERRKIYVTIPGDREDLALLCRAADEASGVAFTIGWIEGDALAAKGGRVEAVRICGWEAGSAADLAAVIGPMSAGRADRLDASVETLGNRGNWLATSRDMRLGFRSIKLLKLLVPPAGIEAPSH